MRWAAVLLLLLGSMAAFASEKKKEKLPVLMHQFYSTLLEMKPFMVSFDEFKAEQNKSKIQALLKGLEAKIDSTEVRDLKAPGFSSTYDLMARHLRDTSYLYEHEIYEMSWNKLRATTQFCITCHERLPKNVGQLKWPAPSSNFSNSEVALRDADFLYIAHQFEPALQTYDQLIRQFQPDPKSPEKNLQLETAYQRKIAYFARIQRDPNAAIASLKLDLKNKNLSLETQKNIETWIHYFDVWSKEGKGNPALLSDRGLIDYSQEAVDKFTGGRKISVSDPYVVNLLRVSGLLYERAFKKAKSESTPEILYLLGKIERDLAPIRSYSLADIYFRECILLSPKKPVAKKCFSEYELAIKTRFRTGASDYIDAGLEELRKMVQ